MKRRSSSTRQPCKVFSAFNIYATTMNKLPILIVLFFFSSCLKSQLETNEKIPRCVKTKIRMLKSKPVQNPSAKVWFWEDDCDNKYYVFSADCCDQGDELYDDECNYLCAPSGGFSGTGSGDCPSYCGNMESTLIWEDKRGN